MEFLRQLARGIAQVWQRLSASARVQIILAGVVTVAVIAGMVVMGTRPDFVISRLESELPVPSYTIDTLKELRQRLAGDTELFFIIGLDAFAEIATWKSYDVLLGQAGFVVITRPSHDPATLEHIMASCFSGYVFDSGTETWVAGEDSDSGRIYVINMKPRNVSSTEIRGLVREGRPVRGLVPRGVEDYIRDKGLYRQK